MKVISWNVNGLRACVKKGAIAQLIDDENPDVLFIQETKMQPDQAGPIIAEFGGYAQHYHSAEKKGYSSVSSWVKTGIDHTVTVGMPGWNDTEGRVIRVDIDDKSLLGVYFPNGGKSPEAWEEKLRFYDHFSGYVNDLQTGGKQVLWGGDINCAHAEIDLARPKDNNGKVGFHPKERSWITKCIQEGWIDLWRAQHPESIIYSWWHMRSGARARNVGWRIDAWYAKNTLYEKVKPIRYLTQHLGSDHCPVICEII